MKIVLEIDELEESVIAQLIGLAVQKVGMSDGGKTIQAASMMIHKLQQAKEKAINEANGKAEENKSPTKK